MQPMAESVPPYQRRSEPPTDSVASQPVNVQLRRATVEPPKRIMPPVDCEGEGQYSMNKSDVGELEEVEGVDGGLREEGGCLRGGAAGDYAIAHSQVRIARAEIGNERDANELRERHGAASACVASACVPFDTGGIRWLRRNSRTRAALLFVKVQSLMVALPSRLIAPRSRPALLLPKLQLLIVAVPKMRITPAFRPALLFVKTQPKIVAQPEICTTPASRSAWLLEIEQLLMTAVPAASNTHTTPAFAVVARVSEMDASSSTNSPADVTAMPPPRLR